MDVKLFSKPGCSLCEGWKKKLYALSIPFEYFDIETDDGLVEMLFNSLIEVPALVIGKNKFNQINPSEITSEELLRMIKEV